MNGKSMSEKWLLHSRPASGGWTPVERRGDKDKVAELSVSGLARRTHHSMFLFKHFDPANQPDSPQDIL